MSNPFKVIGNLFVKLFNFFNSQKAEDLLKLIKDIAEKALPIVELIAALTPTRIDDELIALFKRFGTPNLDKYLALPREERGEALMTVAINELQKLYPELPVSNIRAGIELAVSLSRVK